MSSSIKLQDAHLHLEKDGRPAVAEEIGRIFLNSTSLEDASSVFESAAADSRIIPFAGFHPWTVTDAGTDTESLRSLLKSHPEAGIGECGLDFGGKYKPYFQFQLETFETQLQTAAEFKRPLSIHCVRAWGRMLELLRKYSPLPRSFIIHSFYGAEEISEQIIKMGGFISVSDLSLRNPQRTYSVIRSIPSDRILIESDLIAGSPGFSSEEHLQNLKNIYNTVSEIKNISIHELTDRIWDNGTFFAD